jgi:hypothetical protein
MASLPSEPLVQFSFNGALAPSLVLGEDPKGGGGFNFTTQIALPFSSVSSQLLLLFGSRPIVFAEGLLKQEIRFTDLNIQGIEGFVNIEGKFKGSFDGTILIKGKPVYGLGDQTLYLEDLTYQLKTKNFLLKTASWVLESQIRRRIESASRLALRTYYFKISEGLEALLNKDWGKGIKAKGSVENFQMTGIDVTEEALIARVACSGKVSLAISEDLIPF